MEIKQRVLEYCRAKNIALSKFEKLSGLSNGYFNQVKERPSDKKIESMHSAFPDLNTGWLLTGRGCMFLDSPDTDDSSRTNDYDTFIKELREENYRLMQTIQQLNDRITELNGIISRQNEEIYRLMNERKAYRTG